MNKRNLTFAFVTLVGIACAKAANTCSGDTTSVRPLPILNIDETKTHPIPHVPVRVPTLYICGHTLILGSGCDNTTFELYAEDETLVYSTYVPEGTEHIDLPSDLTGVFELRIVRGSITFVAEIEL